MGTIFGTTGGDNLNGTADDDTIIARGGGDTITGGDGNDTIVIERPPDRQRYDRRRHRLRRGFRSGLPYRLYPSALPDPICC